MIITVIQNKVELKIADSLKNIIHLLENNNIKKTDFIVLPEMFMAPYELKYIKSHKQDKSSAVLEFLKSLALKYNSYVIGGSIPFTENDKIYNTSFVFNRQGELISRYDKIHLFEITYPNGKYFSEASILTRGSNIVTFNTEYGIMGLMICFDLRFAYLAEKLMEKESKIIFVPAAFNTYTGPLHWRTTFRSRAIDNQLFIVGVSPARNSFGKYNPYGHSLIVNPLGEVIKELNDKEDLFVVDIDLNKVEEIRSKLPIIKNRIKL